MSLIPQFKTELQYIPTVKACLKLSQVDCFCLRLKGSLAFFLLDEGRKGSFFIAAFFQPSF